MESDTRDKLTDFRNKASAIRQSAPHPSRPHLSTLIEQSTWDEIHNLFSTSADMNLGADTDDELTAVYADGLCDLCLFVRNAAAMDPQNQTSAFNTRIVDDIKRVIATTATREIACMEAMSCVTIASQALSNLATGNSEVQNALVHSEVVSLHSATDSVFWCMLVSVNAKTNLAGLMTIFNSLKGNAGLIQTIASNGIGRALIRKIGEMFGDNSDDNSDIKNIQYGILSQIIDAGMLDNLSLAKDIGAGSYGLLDALAVYLNENKHRAPSSVISLGLVNSLTGLLTAIKQQLARIWANASDVYSADNEDASLEMNEIVLVHRSFASLMAILCTATEGSDQQFVQWLFECGTLSLLVELLGLLNKNLPRIERASEQEAKERGDVPDDNTAKHLFMFKRDIIQTIANASYKRKDVQNLMRECDGLSLVLDHMRIDENHPFIKEYAVLALRNLLDENQENQDFVRSMSAVGPAPDPQLARAELTSSIDSDGKVHVEVAGSGPASKKARTEK